MTTEERKIIVRELLAKGQTLSQIQDYLSKEKGDSITYMELRLLLSEMPDAKLPEKELPISTRSLLSEKTPWNWEFLSTKLSASVTFW